MASVDGDVATGEMEVLRRQLGEVLIENGRLFAELNDSNAALKEALEQQTTTTEVLRVIASTPTELGQVLASITEQAARLCGADNATMRLVDGDVVRAVANYGFAEADLPVGLRPNAVQPLVGRSHHSQAFAEGRIIYVPDVEEDQISLSVFTGWSALARSVVHVPFFQDGAPVGILHLRSRRPHTFDKHLRLLDTFAAQAVIAIKNARLFQELQERLEEQTATSDILRVIAASPTDLARSLDTIAERAARLTGSTGATVLRVADAFFDRVGVWDDASQPERLPQLPYREPVGPATPSGRAVLERRTILVPDVRRAAEEQGFDAEWAARVERVGFLSFLTTPLINGPDVTGVLVVRRNYAGAYAPREVALLETFAAQAAIAVENARLFTALQERDDRRRQELERASAIQQRLLPEGVQGWPGVLEVAVRFRPAVETSGDFYDVLRLAPAEEGGPPPLQIAVGDVAGKGMSAALVTALARSALRATASVPMRMASPAGTLREAGARLHRDVGAGPFVACALAVIEPPGVLNAGPLLRLANAAQVPVLLCREGRVAEAEPPGDRLPLGARPDGAYEDAKLELRPADVVVFSSDGLVEAPALAATAVGAHLTPPEREGELFGFARLSVSASHWSQHAPAAEDVAAGIWSDLSAWCGEESHHDDMTLLVLRVADAGR